MADATRETSQSAMTARQRIVRERREYNQWVANQTLEDYALRFTAKSARRWSALRVANTALGSISFLALEAIGGTITVAYGFTNSVAAILVVSLLIFAISLPICFYAARDGVDIDLLTRGAGFGYIGSTITSLIYASFTFIFFGIEAVIVASMLETFFGIPLWLGYIFTAAAVVPLVTHGITLISRFQLWTQPVWLVLNLIALIAVVAAHPDWIGGWVQYEGTGPTATGSFNPIYFGAAASILLALITQTAEQVDYLRFMPPRGVGRRGVWWVALLAGGPGWIVFDVFKLLAGSFLAYGVLQLGELPISAVKPAQMYLMAFGDAVRSPMAALILASFFVVLSQIKINITNAYAGSIAWSNFFSRLTHSHPGRVVWLVFNIAIALLLMELGAYETIQRTLVLYSNVATAWIGALVADLIINKPLGFSPPGIEFKRAHLYDINPVGVGAMLLAVLVSFSAWWGVFGPLVGAMSTFIAFAVAFVAAPLIAWATKGRYYLARKPRTAWGAKSSLQCSICEHAFEPEDMAYCPVYTGPICSLCCSLDARCNDGCKPHARADAQIATTLGAILPASVMRAAASPLGRFAGVFMVFVAAAGLVVLGIFARTSIAISDASAYWQAFFVLVVIGGVAAWLLVLAQESRRVAQEETRRQTGLLMSEIRAHRRTDAALQHAKEVAETASLAKSHFVTSINHELRSPLNAILGYAQLLERDPSSLERRGDALRIIRRSGEHLAALVEGLLDISRIEAKRIDIYRDDVALPEFLAQLVDMFRLQAEDKGIGFVFDPPATMPARVHTDEHRLRQILINLLSNAIKFTPEGQVTLRVRWRTEIAEFEVIDTGIGIPPNDLERIFEPLQRVKASGGQPGMGLGLTIAKVLTEIMGGEITVTSQPGLGSRFRVRLMLSGSTQIVRPALTERRIMGYAGARRTVVVADDDPVHRTLLADLLTPLGFSVLLAVDGPDCLQIAARGAPDLFLIDLSMPGMNGWELARELRETHALVPIVIISADGRELKQPPMEAVHHDDTLTKPVSLTALLERIGRLLHLAWISPEPDAVPDADPSPRLSAEQLDKLRELAAIGYVSGLRTQLDVFERETPENSASFAHLRGLLAEYRLDAFLSALDAAGNAKGKPRKLVSDVP
jgi:signal transduction histidine kinase/CheY-like chemotaxis protein/purine-cytosine permease-like protein